MSTQSVEQQRKLTPKEWDICNAVEQYYYLDGEIPSLQRIADVTGQSKRDVERVLSDSVVEIALTMRGISIGRSTELLSTEQLSALSVFFDTKDGRSLKKKLNDIGVTTQQWDIWKQDSLFQRHLRSRAESALEKNLAETEVALLDSAHRGDISAIKLHLELAGRWSSKTVGELNVEFLLMKILEAVQKHVKDPEAIENIANELMVLAPQQQIPGAAALPVGNRPVLPL